MRKTKILATLLLVVATLQPLAAAETIGYDQLHDAMVVNNTQIRQAIEDHNTAALDVKDAKSAYHPQINYTLAGSYVYSHQGMMIERCDIDSMLEGQNPAAGTILGMIQFPIDASPLTEVNDFYVNAQVSLVQPIYTWGKIGASVDMAKELETIKALQVGDTESQLDAQLKAYLASLHYLKEISALLEGMAADADRLVEISKVSSETGMVIATDAAEAEVARQQVTLAQTQIDAQIDSVITNIEVLTGMDGLRADSIEFVPDEDWFRELAAMDRGQLELLATSGSQTTVQMLNHAVSAASYGQKAADRSMYVVPDIALSVSANYTAPINSSWIDNQGWGVTVAVAMQGDIWDGGKKLNDQARAESAVASAQASKDAALGTIRQNLDTALSNMNVAIANLAYQDANISLLESQLEVEETKAGLGAGSESDVLSKRMELQQAQIDKISTEVELAANAYTVEYLTGLEPSEV